MINNLAHGRQGFGAFDGRFRNGKLKSQNGLSLILQFLIMTVASMKAYQFLSCGRKNGDIAFLIIMENNIL